MEQEKGISVLQTLHSGPTGTCTSSLHSSDSEGRNLPFSPEVLLEFHQMPTVNNTLNQDSTLCHFVPCLHHLPRQNALRKNGGLNSQPRPQPKPLVKIVSSLNCRQESLDHLAGPGLDELGQMLRDKNTTITPPVRNRPSGRALFIHCGLESSHV